MSTLGTASTLGQCDAKAASGGETPLFQGPRTVSRAPEEAEQMASNLTVGSQAENHHAPGDESRITSHHVETLLEVARRGECRRLRGGLWTACRAKECVVRHEMSRAKATAKGHHCRAG